MKRVLIFIIIFIIIIPYSTYAQMTIDYNQKPSDLTEQHIYLTVWGNITASNLDDRMYTIIWSNSPIIGFNSSSGNDTLTFPKGINVREKRDGYKDSYDYGWNNYTYANEGLYGGGPGYKILWSNYDVRALDNTMVHESDVIKDETYYIKDEAKIFNEEQKKKLYDMEKKWEINGLQFFVLTHNDNNDNQQKILEFGNQKIGSGHGELIISVIKKSDGSLMCGFAPSRAFLKHGYYEIPHFRYAQEFFYYLQRQDIKDTLEYRLNSILQNMIYKDKEYSDTLFDGYIFGRMRECKFLDLNIDNYTLKYTKLPYCNENDINLKNWVFIGKNNDVIGFSDENYVEYLDHWYNPLDSQDQENLIIDDNHVWFSNILSIVSSSTPTSQYTPTPTPTPASYKTPIPTITSYTPIPLPEPPGGNISWPSVSNEVYKKLPIGLINSLYRINEIQTKPVAPVLKLNFYKLLKPLNDNFGSTIGFEDKDTVIMDYNYFNDDIKFLGFGLFTWFRSLMSAFIVYKTIIAIKDRFTPNEPIN